MTDGNDMRAAIGMLVHGQTDHADKLDRIIERLDDIGALAARSARLAELVEDVDTMVDALPNALRNMAHDPAIGMLMGAQLHEMASNIEQAVSARRQQRASAPGIEKG